MARKIAPAAIHMRLGFAHSRRMFTHLIVENCRLRSRSIHDNRPARSTRHFGARSGGFSEPVSHFVSVRMIEGRIPQ
jgi:hypothetical protein